MARDSDEAGDLLVPQFVKNVQHAVFGFHLFQIVRAGETVHMNKVYPIGLQPLQAPFENPLRIISIPRVDLRGQKDLLAAVLHDLSHPRLALPVAVTVRRVEIMNTQLERQVDRGNRLLLALIRQKSTSASQRQNGDLDSGPAQNASR